RIDEGALLLGGREVPVAGAVEAVLRRVGEEAARTAGRAPEDTVLTHPAGWGPQRRGLLLDAAGRAGLPAVTLVPEPVAAAMYFTTVLGHHVPDGHAVVVYDFGGGTFDISVVRRAGAGWEVAAAQGLDDVGGVDLDAAIVGWVGAQVATRDPALWARLESPAGPPDRRHRKALWDDARSVKELLSRASSGGIAVPLFDVDLHLTRDEFEALARPWLDRTVTLTTATLFTSGVSADRLAGVFLVGGGSRVPLAETLLHRALGVPPVVLEQPELVVALGSLLPPAAEDAAVVPPVPVLRSPAPAPVSPAPAPVSPAPAPVSPAPAPAAPVAPAPAPATVSPAPVSPAPTPAPVAPAPASAPVSPAPDSPAPVSSPPTQPTPVVPFAASTTAAPGSAAATTTVPPELLAGPHPINRPEPPPPAPPAAAASRTETKALLIACGAVLVLGLAGILFGDHPSRPPLHSGFFSPLVPKAVAILLGMTVLLAVTGRPSGPAHRALGPALLATAGGVLALYLVFSVGSERPAFTFAGGTGYRLAAESSVYTTTLSWLFTVVAGLLAAGGIVLLVRRRRAADAPVGGSRGWWIALWPAAGAALMLATMSPVSYYHRTLVGGRDPNVSPLAGIAYSDGALTWWLAFTLGLALTLSAWLLVGAALRPWLARSRGARVTALVLVVVLGLFAVLSSFFERAYYATPLRFVREYYWNDVIGLPAGGAATSWVELLVAVGVIGGIAVPSLVRTRRL
ncbi:Hsp70 family protein, partial [Dactylosporangium sp. NPDC051485]|uniref:Hsp70 family protein n=1 Tax=Dactylosporangium sp. NPDC051485 TaxID=3154846 RepID=UPI00342A95D9